MKSFGIAILALLLIQEPPPGNGRYSTDRLGPITFYDPDTGAIEGQISGHGTANFDPKLETGELIEGDFTYYYEPGNAKPGNSKRPTRKIQLLFNRCNIGRIEKGDQKHHSFQCTGGVRGFLDEDVRFWTEEASMDYLTKVVHCPKPIRLVHYAWPLEFDVATFLAFLGPKESAWLHLFGGPRPNLILRGDDLQVDTASSTLTVSQKGHLVVLGNPSPDGERKKERKRKPDRDLRTDLKCEGPLRIRGLSNEFAESQGLYHVTAERDVVLERLVDGRMIRVRSDAASIHVSVRREDNGDGIRTALQAVSLRGGIRLEDGQGLVATADRLDWNHQEDLLKLRGAPLVEVVQAEQKLQARDVVFDRWTGLVSFEGEIEATIRPISKSAKGAPDPLREVLGFGPFRKSGGPGVQTMTLKPGRLEMRTSKDGKPEFLRAWGGVRLTGLLGAAGPEPIEAEGSAFEWDVAADSGVLRGSPCARIVRGPQQVFSPLVSFEGDSFMVIKGPSLLKFRIEDPLEGSASAFEAALGLRGLQSIPDRNDAVMEVSVTSDRDVVFDQESRLVKLIDRCVIRTQDSSLTADLLYVILDAKGRGIERVMGFGDIRMNQQAGPKRDAIDVTGELLEFNPSTKDILIHGKPLARVVQGTREFSAAKVRHNHKKNRTEFWTGQTLIQRE